MNTYEKLKKAEKGCKGFLYQSEESNYSQSCDGASLCNGTLRLCKKCQEKVDKLTFEIMDGMEQVNRKYEPNLSNSSHD